MAYVEYQRTLLSAAQEYASKFVVKKKTMTPSTRTIYNHQLSDMTSAGGFALFKSIQGVVACSRTELSNH